VGYHFAKIAVLSHGTVALHCQVIHKWLILRIVYSADAEQPFGCLKLRLLGKPQWDFPNVHGRGPRPCGAALSVLTDGLVF